MSPADELKHEHKTILMVLGAAERKIAEWKAAGRVDRPYMAEMIDFFINFIDRCHHTKEEKHYFKKMTDRDKEAVLSLVTVLLQEHEEERRRLKATVESLSRVKAEGMLPDFDAIEKNLLGYVTLIQDHIVKEDQSLYTLTDRILTTDDQRALIEVFRKIELKEMGHGGYEKYEEVARRLAES
ncbi:MAG: Hemerythrin HHE cation binding domain protein [Syntrophorhabdaceae bacterium PtaU1.Bin034]|nr:MAG: Hemerythrin HHE cation binding domain protein [Syntrophorhabdaceae bacterium PtaU1.Bin034]